MQLLSSLVLDLLSIKEVQSLSLNLTVDEGTSKSSKDLLSRCMAVRLAY